MVKTGVCISDTQVNDYLTGSLSAEKKAEIESHIANCNACLEKIVFAYETVEEFNKESLPAGRQGRRLMKKERKNNMWLYGAILTFILSFPLQRYFMQLLVATILMGGKWIFDSMNARILITIYEAWKHGGEQEASKILKNLNNRF